MTEIELSVVLTPDEEGGFIVECPAIPGCISQGDTREEALSNIREAIALWSEKVPTNQIVKLLTIVNSD